MRSRSFQCALRPHPSAFDRRHHAGDEWAGIGPRISISCGPGRECFTCRAIARMPLPMTACWKTASRCSRNPLLFPALKAKVQEKLSRLSRAQRFNLHLPLKYRLVGEGLGAKAPRKTSAVRECCSGQKKVSPNAMLEISMVLPAEIAGLSAAEVVCRGEIVRALEPEQPTMNPALAAKILQYHFQHGSPQPPG